jgi:hypothetical protein
MPWAREIGKTLDVLEWPPKGRKKKTCPIDSQFLVDGKENKTSSQAVKNAIEYPYPIPSNTDWLATAHISHKNMSHKH